MIRSKFASDEKLESCKEEHMTCHCSIQTKREEKDDRKETFFFLLGLFFLRLGDSCNSILDENGAWRILKSREIYIGHLLVK